MWKLIGVYLEMLSADCVWIFFSQQALPTVYGYCCQLQLKSTAELNFRINASHAPICYNDSSLHLRCLQMLSLICIHSETL